jgi:hypothetical protein
MFTKPRTPGTRRTASSRTRRSSAPPAQPCRVITKEQELTFGLDRPRVVAFRLKELCTSWSRRASLATVVPEDTLVFGAPCGAQLGEEGKPAVAQPALVQRLLELGLAGKLYLPGSGGLDQGGEVLLLARREA